MKKIVSMILAIVLLFGMTGCDEQQILSEVKSAVSPVVKVFEAETIKETEYEMEYIGNKNSKKLHLPSCHTLPKESNRIYFLNKESAIQKNYDPCKNCHP